MKSKILINASNLHSGGAVAVASSFINELSKLVNLSDDISILVSSEVHENLRQKNTTLNVFTSYNVQDVYGIKAIWSGLNKVFKKYEVVFTIFGPAYFLNSDSKHIFGFAQPWIVYPQSSAYSEFSFVNRVQQKLKYYIQSLFFSRADALVVELEHVKVGLKQYRHLSDIPTHIVNSTVDSVFNCPSKWQQVEFPSSTAEIKLGVISRNYSHKNLKCLPELKRKLFSSYNMDVDFYVTFSEQEWSACSEEFRTGIINIGLLNLDQCPSFYNQIDGVFFPTLLECFSATPLEAMIMKKPLFSSDLSFIRDCSKHYANYFDPLDVNDMAKVIAEYYLNNKNAHTSLDAARNYVIDFSSSSGRAKGYLSIITASLNNSEKL